MLDERTYREDEVAEIFEAAARPVSGRSTLARPEGFTLAELQAIGSEAGLSPERIAEAAAAVELRRGAVRQKDLGMPVSVGRTVDLPRAPTDREWEMIVADLRETFGARGRLGSREDVREWHNGNLHAYVEPTTTGYRLRLGTTKGDGVGLNRMGGLGSVFALLWLVVFLVGYGPSQAPIIGPLLMLAVSAAALGYNALRLPGWALEREQQMEQVAARARSLLGAPEPQQPATTALPLAAGLAGEISTGVGLREAEPIR